MFRRFAGKFHVRRGVSTVRGKISIDLDGFRKGYRQKKKKKKRTAIKRSSKTFSGMQELMFEAFVFKFRLLNTKITCLIKQNRRKLCYVRTSSVPTMFENSNGFERFSGEFLRNNENNDVETST